LQGSAYAPTETHTLPLTLLSSCLHRCLTITLIFAVCLASSSAWAVSCKVATYAPSEAYQLFLHGAYDRAVTLYQTQLLQKPDDPALTASLAQVLLKQQKLTQAEDIVRKAMIPEPKSVILLTALGEIQYREGKPWLAFDTAATALKLDPCNAHLHLLTSRLYQLNSLYSSAAKEIATAHALEPDDPSIRLHWLENLPGAQRISELEAYLASPTGADPEELRHLHFYLDFLKAQAELPHKACRLASDTATTNIPFIRFMRDADHIRAFGLEVKLNDHTAHLEIDTGASGLVISRSVANRAGLQRISKEVVGGVGDRGGQAAYTAHADSIKIGSLEFRDCDVEVIDQRNVVDSDGLIGMDVFSRFLITLDYPMRKLLLGPLPPRPDEVASAKPALETANVPDNYNDEDNSGPVSSETAQTAAPRALHNRYIAPEMKDWTLVYRVGHNLLLPASLNNSNIRLFVLDTGAFTTSVSPAVAREVTKVHTNDLLTVKGISGNVDKIYTADQITFKFANLSQTIRDVVAFDTPEISRAIGMDVSGFIGFTALGETTMKIDYRDGLVSFSYDANRGYKF
jgi:predicted aspartyl protease/Tfp pilus assembly protein PilF